MNAYDISQKLCQYGYDSDNTSQTSSMLHLLDAADKFGIDSDVVWSALSRGHALYGHVGHIYIDESSTSSLWFALLDNDERELHPGMVVRYSIRGIEYDEGCANGDEIKVIYA